MNSVLRKIHKAIDVEIDRAIRELRELVLNVDFQAVNIYWNEVASKLRRQGLELLRIAKIIEEEIKRAS